MPSPGLASLQKTQPLNFTSLPSSLYFFPYLFFLKMLSYLNYLQENEPQTHSLSNLNVTFATRHYVCIGAQITF